MPPENVHQPTSKARENRTCGLEWDPWGWKGGGEAAAGALAVGSPLLLTLPGAPPEQLGDDPSTWIHGYEHE